eukprot:2340425-Pyramimonas_sp.AAC.1
MGSEEVGYGQRGGRVCAARRSGMGSEEVGHGVKEAYPLGVKDGPAGDDPRVGNDGARHHEKHAGGKVEAQQ